jgi:hypothetical protein
MMESGCLLVLAGCTLHCAKRLRACGLAVIIGCDVPLMLCSYAVQLVRVGAVWAIAVGALNVVRFGGYEGYR